MGDTIFSSMAIDAIGEIMNISLGSSATAVSNMLDHRVDITTPTVSVVNAEEFELGEIEPAVGVEIKYVSGLDGSNIMLLKRSDVKAIVDILLMTETADEDFVLDDLSISCVCELMNQMMGSASTALSDLLGRMVNISTPESFELDDLDKVRREHFPVQTGPVVVVKFHLTIENTLDSEFMNVMSIELAKDLVAGFGLDMGEDSAPAPAPEPASGGGGGGVLSQEEIERLMSGGAAAAAPEPAPAPASSGGGGGVLSQEEIERLMSGGAAAPAPQSAPAPAPHPQTPPAAQPAAPAAAAQPATAADIGSMMAAMMAAMTTAMANNAPAKSAPPPEPKIINAQKPKMQELDAEARLSAEQKQNLDLIMSVPLEVAVEIGRTKRKIQDIIAFSKGSLVVLDKLAGDQVDLFVNGQCIARGDVVVIDDNFGIRITEILQKPDINELVQS